MTNQPPAASPPAAPPPVNRFGVHWIAALPVLALAATVAALMREIARAGPASDGNEHRAMGQAFGTLLWGVFLAFCVAWVAWQVAGRSRFASTIAFMAVIVLVTRSTTQKLSAMAGPRAAAAHTILPGISPRAAADGSGQSAAPSPDAAVHAARERAAGRLFDNQEQGKALLKRWRDAGGADLVLPDSTGDLERRLALLEEMIAGCRQIRAAEDLAVAAFGRELGAAGLPKLEREKLAADFGAAAEQDANRRLMDASHRVMVADQELLGFLRAQWGGWTYEPETGECRFDDEASGEHYGRLDAEAKFARGELANLTHRQQHPDDAAADD